MSRFVYASRANVPDYVIRGGNTYRIFADHLGSPRVAVNVDNPSDMPLVMEHDTFGNVIHGAASADWLPMGFAGGHYDAETGLVRFGARDYDAYTGRWTAKDPILFAGGAANLYEYVGSDPVNEVDPFGLSKFDNLFGLPKKFWSWYHRNVKGDGDPDLQYDEAMELFEDWKLHGKPGPDSKGKWKDILDMLSPFPDVFDPCANPSSGLCLCPSA